MRRIAVESLPRHQALARPLYHESGHLLFREGERVEDDEVERLVLNGILRVYDLGDEGPGGEETVGAPKRTSSAPLSGAPRSRGSAPGTAPTDVLPPPDVQRFLRDRRASRVWRELEGALPLQIEAERLLRSPASALRNGSLERVFEESRAGEEPEGRSLSERLAEARPYPPRTRADKEDALETRRAAVAAFAQTLGRLRATEPVALEEIGRVARSLLGLALHDPDLALAFRLDQEPAGAPNTDGALPAGDVHLAHHAVNVATHAIATAAQIGYEPAQLFELCHAALLHDVGMLRVSQDLVTKTERLSDDERAELERHPVQALKVLRRLDRLPLSVPSVAYHVHERADGSGYPEGQTGPALSPFARIVAVCDVFDAMTSPRPHRAAKGGHLAARDLIGEASARRLHVSTVRAALGVLSLFPVGTYVALSDDRTARVVRAEKMNGRPLVAVAPEDPDDRWMLLDLSVPDAPSIQAPDVDPPAGTTLLSGF